MADRDSTDRGPTGRTNHEEELRDQGVVLIQVLALHPAHLTVSELVREITAGAPDFDAEDRYSRAVDDLCGAGLLHLSAGLVSPTRAALVFNNLDRD
jgi:hypothetical protein